MISKIVPKKKKIKFLTCYPKHTIYPLLKIIANVSSISKYLHIPPQSGSNEILKKMNRGYTREEYLDLVRSAYRQVPNLCISGDIIVGFPSESTKDFEESIKLISEVKYSSLFVAKYSPRPFTTSYTYYNQILPESIKYARYNYILKLQHKIQMIENQKLLFHVLRGFVFEVCNNEPNCLDMIMLVKTENEKVIFIFDKVDILGLHVLVKVTKVNSSKIFGKVIKIY